MAKKSRKNDLIYKIINKLGLIEYDQRCDSFNSLKKLSFKELTNLANFN
jgi:hypothetical protein